MNGSTQKLVVKDITSIKFDIASASRCVRLSFYIESQSSSQAGSCDLAQGLDYRTAPPQRIVNYHLELVNYQLKIVNDRSDHDNVDGIRIN